MSNIKLIFRNNNIFRILQLFSVSKNQKYYLREIARQLGLSAGAIHGDLAILEKTGLIASQVEGKNKYFSANNLNPDFNHLRPILGGLEKPSASQKIITVLFEEHWVSPLTQAANYFGWQASSDDRSFSTRLGDCAGVYYNTFLKFPFDEEGWTARSREVNERLENEKFISKHYTEFITLTHKLDNSLVKIIKQPVVDDLFIKDLKELYLLGIEACRLGYIGVVADLPTEFLSKNMRAIVESRTANIKTKETVPEIVNILSAPPELSKSFQREKALLKLGQAAAKQKIKKLSETSRLWTDIQDYFRRYYWTDFGHFGTEKLPRDVWEEIQSLVKNESLAAIYRRIKEIDNYQREIRNKKELIYKKLSLSKKERMIFESAGIFSLVKALRLEYLSGLNSQISRLTSYLSKKYKLNKEFFYFCQFGEILDIYEHGLKPGFAQVLRSRSKFCIFRDFSDCYSGQILAGREAQDFYKKYVKEVQKEINDIESFHGSVAYPGKARGAVKIVNSPKEMSKINSGDILVTNQTVPEMLPAMRLAAAFVTNSGGITCHAAIVARKMKKTCIVGTKIATRVLHDGDFVQVDAFKGIINIIRIS